ncbi:hypothetical protein NKH45_33980, partial [Mesorhizobium sp. M1156]
RLTFTHRHHRARRAHARVPIMRPSSYAYCVRNEYPGPHIPAPIQIGAAGETDIRQRAIEILALTKMNWNSTDGMSRAPITLSFARKVGMLMAELSDNQHPNPSYKFYT